MKTATLPVLLLGLLAFGPLQAAPQHDHAAHAAYDGQPVPLPAPRWSAGATLREGMGRIHAALEELRHYEMGHMDATMALARVGLIEAAVSDLFAHCRLGPEQDAVVHRMLVPLLDDARRLRVDPRDMAEVAAMRRDVADYPRYFDDPGWSADAAPMPAMAHGH
ncbi:DnrO protein [Fulvimonas soli]|uniref:DnrO protein n=1 Tax=Fulvimonas soli TaxID=155197 RepID=A0A316HYF5_9GAMM|nr:DnrO protein [Fulvimonas soli]PWK85770.1 hypothetical protein C7456_10865 [Fulvimonas soli]TNY25716.1 DnrO protein [Fulvimonas soli]